MAYAEVSDVEGYYKGVTFGTNTTVTKAHIDIWLDDYTNIINAKIRNRYTVPIEDTDEEAFSVVKKICEYFVVADIDDVLADSQPIPKDTYVRDRANKYRKLAKEWLKELEEGSVELANIIKTESQRFYNSNVANNRCPEFDLSTKDQW